MNKQTKRIKRNKPNKRTRKYRGGADPDVNAKSKGIIDIIGDKISSYSGKAFDYVKEKGLRLAGLQSIKQEEQEEPVVDHNTKLVDESIDKIGNAASNFATELTSGISSGISSGITSATNTLMDSEIANDAKKISSDVRDVFDKGSAAVVGNINEVLQSPQVEESVSKAGEETAEIGEKLLDDFNDKVSDVAEKTAKIGETVLEEFNEKLNSPKMKEETKEALDNAADYAEIAVEAMDKPLDKAIDELNDAGAKAASGAVTGLIKVGTDAIAAVPGAGAVIEVGKMLNDITAAAGDVVEASSEATSAVANVVSETSHNINEGLEKLEEKKEGLTSSMNPDINFKPDKTLNELNKEGTTITNRVNNSIDKFENPVNTVPQLKGGRKTRRKFLKHKGKSKRVRFAV